MANPTIGFIGYGNMAQACSCKEFTEGWLGNKQIFRCLGNSLYFRNLDDIAIL